MYAIIQQRLDDEFLPRGGGACGLQSSYIISTKICLSIALRYFAGGSVYDIMLVHSVSMQSIYDSVWGVINVINNTPELDFHFDFPSKEQQQELSMVFAHGVVPGSIIWLVQLTALLYVLRCQPCWSVRQ